MMVVLFFLLLFFASLLVSLQTNPVYMHVTTENVLLIGSVLLFLSILAGKAGYRFGIPVLLLFLGVGMIFGSDGVGIEFNSPYIAQFTGLAALSVILFSGGLDTNIKDIKPVLLPGLLLSSVGVLITTLVTGVIIYFATNIYFNSLAFSLSESFLFGAIISSTDSASVFSILRSKGISLKRNVRPLLELESGSNDPMAFMLTIVFLEMTMNPEVSALTFVFKVIRQFIVGGLSGFLFAKATLFFIRRVDFENKSLYHILLLSSLFFIFSFTDLIGGNGFLAVYLAGLVIGNSKSDCDQSVITFFDGIAWLAQLIMFLTLGLLVNPSELISLEVAGMGLLVSVVTIFISRPYSVFITLMPFKTIDSKMRDYISWVGLKGAVPIVFATYPLIAGQINAGVMFNIVFFITIVSLLIQGTTVNIAAERLGIKLKQNID
jgi:cell volume regulation protein A